MPPLPPSRSLPFPPWLLAADVVASLLLVAGLLAVMAPSSLPWAVPGAAAWAALALGTLATLGASIAILRHLRAAAAPR